MGPEFDIGPYRLWFVVESCGIACSLAVRTHANSHFVSEKQKKNIIFTHSRHLTPPKP